jgi:SAM-dependent methyltransferase
MHILDIPAMYQGFQEFWGFFNARFKAIDEFLPLKPGMKVLDIGCGPGYTQERLPAGLNYIGFDTDSGYIAHAKKRCGTKGKFYHRFFDAKTAKEFAGADVVMMNGVMHHIPDAELSETLKNIHAALKPGGVLFTLDGCRYKGQSWFKKFLIDIDRGKFVRTEKGYRTLLEPLFNKVEMHVRESYPRIPYTLVVGVCHKEKAAKPKPKTKK